MKKSEKFYGKLSEMKRESMKVVLGGGYKKTQGNTSDTTHNGSASGDYSEPGDDSCWYYPDGSQMC